MLKILYILAVISTFILMLRKFLKLKLDTAEVRRKVFPPMLAGKRSHPSPQTCWHPALKISKNLDGSVDDVSLERRLDYKRGFYHAKRGGVKIFWQSWRPKTLEKVSHGMVVCHGYGDHSDYGERQKSMTFALLNNAWVFTFDYPGHGRSDGLWGLISDWKLLIAQIAETIEEVFLPKLSAIKKPLFCLGTSQGGAAAIHLCMYRPKLFRGLLLLCPMCDVADEVKPSAVVTNALVFFSKIAGKLPVSPVRDFTILIFKNPKEYELQKVGPYRNLLCYSGKPRLATSRELLFASIEIIQRAALDFRTPFLLVHGDCDQVCPIEKSKEFYEKAGVEDKTFEEISGGWHFLFDPIHNPERTYGLMFNWINQRID